MDPSLATTGPSSDNDPEPDPDPDPSIEPEPDPNPEPEVDPQDNPLYNVMVLANLFGYLPVKDLRSCRRVNSIWYDESTPQLQALGRGIFFKGPDADAQPYQRNLPLTQFGDIHHDLAAMEEILEMYESSENGFLTVSNFPTYDFRLDAQIFASPASPEYQTLNRFLVEFSPYLKGISLHGISVCDFDMNSLPTNWGFPELHTLSVYQNEGFRSTDNLSAVAKHIVSVSPNITSVGFTSYLTPSGGGLDKFLNALEMGGVVARIQDLYIFDQLHQKEWQTLTKMGFQLTRMIIWLRDGSQCSTESLTKILKTQSETLENFEINHLGVEKEGQLHFPRMKKLTMLTVRRTGQMENVATFSVASPVFKEALPWLKKLTLSTGYLVPVTQVDNWTDLLNTDWGQKSDSLKHLRLERGATVKILDRASKLFPRLSTLEILVNLELAREVFFLFPNLETLGLYTARRCEEEHLYDQIISGRSKEGCMQIKNNPDELQRMLEPVTKPNIRTLQKLKVIKLRCDANNPNVGPTIVSCLELLNLPSLQCLDFDGKFPPEDKIPSEMITRMKSQFMVLE